MVVKTDQQLVEGPVLIMIRGLPGSGKSYLAEALQDSIGQDRVLVLDPDKIKTRDEEYLKFSDNLSAEGLDKTIHPFRWSRKLACDGVVRGKIIIWNQPFTIRGIFDRLVLFMQNYAKVQNISVPVLNVEVEIDQNSAKNRINDRKKSGGHGPSINTFNKRISEYKSFADGYETIVVDGVDRIDKSVNKIIEHLKELS